MIPMFSQDQIVRVIRRDQPGHVRTPRYLRNRVGRIARVCGAFPNPELLAKGGLGIPYRILYRVAFSQQALWPDYRGAEIDELFADLYEHWLEVEEELQ